MVYVWKIEVDYNADLKSKYFILQKLPLTYYTYI